MAFLNMEQRVCHVSFLYSLQFLESTPKSVRAMQRHSALLLTDLIYQILLKCTVKMFVHSRFLVHTKVVIHVYGIDMDILSFIQDTNDTGSSSRQSVNDILTKLIRVIANISVSEHIGTSLCDNKKCVEYLLHILGKYYSSLVLKVGNVTVLQVFFLAVVISFYVRKLGIFYNNF